MTDTNKHAATAITPYLFFGGRTQEAIDFYTKAADAKVDMVMRFKDAPDQPPEGMDFNPEAIMHSSFSIHGTNLMASDGCGETPSFEGFSLALSVANEKEAHRIFNGLSEGGKVEMPLGATFWSPCYGMLTDKFGLGWMVMVPMECGPDA